MIKINYTPWATSTPPTIEPPIIQQSKTKSEPLISIIIPSNKIGGLDVLFESLQNQTRQDFELILIDGLYKHRKDIVKEKAQEYNFTIKHIEPTKNIFPISNYCNSINTGLVNSSSNLILLLEDYTYLPEKCVERHINFHLACPAENIGCVGAYQYKKLPELHNDFIKYEETDLYINDLKLNKLNNILYSIFKSNFNQDIETLPIDNTEPQDIKLSMNFNEVPASLFESKNVSFKLSAALNVNGFDEELDGAEGCQNNLFSSLLKEKLDFICMIDKDNIVNILNTKNIIPNSKQLRSSKINLDILKEKLSNKFNKQINNYNLIKLRNKILQKKEIIKSNKKSPKISIIIPTNRAGGLDVLFESLKNQSFKDFELILVDAIYNARKKIVEEKSKLYDFTVKHIEPSDNTFPVSNYCKSINTGLVAAEGELVYFTCDYAYLNKDTLLAHSQFHSNTPRNFILMAPIDVCEFNHNRLSSKFPMERQYGTRGEDKKYQLLTVPEEVYVSAHNKWSEDYAEDVAAGKLDEVLWSIFDKEISNNNLITDIITTTSPDTKFNNLSNEIPKEAFHDFVCLKNDSFKREFLMEVGGMNELLDGGHGFQDSELARNIKHLYNGKFFALNNYPVSVINTRFYLEPRKIVKGYNNIKIIDSEYLNPKPRMSEVIKKYMENKNEI